MKSFVLFLIVCVSTSIAVLPGRVVVSGDEWIFTNTAFANDFTNSNNFLLNVAKYFTNGVPSNLLVYSSDSFAYDSTFQNILAVAGHTVTVDAVTPLSAAFLAPYKAVFLAGNVGTGAANLAVLLAYHNAGGHIFLEGGTGFFGNAPNEAAAWNPLLANFGLALGTIWGPISSVIDATLVPGFHPLHVGVSKYFWGFGHEVIDLDNNPANANRIAIYADFSAFPGSFGGSTHLNNFPIVGVYSLSCFVGSQTFTISAPVTFAGAPAACAALGLKLADLTVFNWNEATTVAWNCIGANKAGWIHSYNTDTYSPSCIQLNTGTTAPGGAVTVGVCATLQPAICQTI